MTESSSQSAVVDGRRAMQLEAEFLSGVEANLEAAKGKVLRGSNWQLSRHDEQDRLRALLAESRRPDRELLSQMPANRRIALHGYERRLFLFKRPTGVAIASVVSPLSHFASGSTQAAPPVGVGELLAHVRKLAGDGGTPHVIGVCSPTGFSEEARNLRMDLGNVQVVLIEPGETGGWRTRGTGEAIDPRLLKIFDPEAAKQKIERVQRLVEERSADLLIGGVSASALAAQAGQPEEVVRAAMRQVAAQDPELRLTERDGEYLLFRGAPAGPMEKRSMNVFDRIRQLLSGDASDAAKVNLLAERRALLAQRRDRLYEDIGRLESKEAQLLAEGRAATSAVPRRRLAAQLAQLRKDIARQNATAGMLNQQINIISTDIHNLTLLQQGKMAQLPDTETLTEHAVRAEEMLESLRADSELVGSLEQGMEEVLASDEELAILKEFEQAAGGTEPRDKHKAPPAASRRASAAPVRPPATERGAPSPEPAVEPPDEGDRSPQAEAS